MRTKDSILSLDVSSFSTGWAHWEYTHPEGKKKEIVRLKGFGVLAPRGDVSSRRLVVFENMLRVLVYDLSPSIIVLEDLNHTRNMEIVKVLGAFLGTAKKISYEYLQREPIQIARTAVLKTVLGRGNAEKPDVIAFVNQHFGASLDASEKASEDIADAIVTGYCHIVQIRALHSGGAHG